MNDEILAEIARKRAGAQNYKKITYAINRKFNTMYTVAEIKAMAYGVYGQVEPKYKMRDLSEAIKRIVTPIDPIDYQRNPELSKDYQATLVISDVHIGKKCEGYSSSIAIARLCWLINKAALEVITRYKGVSTLNIVFVGDIVDGMSIYPKQAHYIDNSLLGQVFDGISAISSTIGSISDKFNWINVYATYGNHGRLSYYYDELSNLDLMFYKALQLGCSQLKNVIFSISNQSLFKVKLGQHTALLVHGEDVKSGSLSAITTRVINWLATEKYHDVDIFILGHFHTSSNYQCQRAYVIVNGTTVTGDRYAIEKMGKDCKPCQTLFLSTVKEPVDVLIYLYPESNE